LLRRAIEEKEGEHLFHLALARTLYLEGDREAAELSLARARELASEQQLADLNRPLSELVDE